VSDRTPTSFFPRCSGHVCATIGCRPGGRPSGSKLSRDRLALGSSMLPPWKRRTALGRDVRWPVESASRDSRGASGGAARAPSLLASDRRASARGEPSTSGGGLPRARGRAPGSHSRVRLGRLLPHTPRPPGCEDDLMPVQTQNSELHGAMDTGFERVADRGALEFSSSSSTRFGPNRRQLLEAEWRNAAPSERRYARFPYPPPVRSGITTAGRPCSAGAAARAGSRSPARPTPEDVNQHRSQLSVARPAS